MFIFGNLFIALARVLEMAIHLLTWLIVIRALLSWFSPDPYNFLVQLLYRLTEPVLYPFRKLIPAYNIGIDISPILAIMALVFLRVFLVSSLYQLGSMLR